MEHKKFLELEKIVSESIKNNKSAREMTLEIVDFLEKGENKNPFNIVTDSPWFWNKISIRPLRGNERINNPSAKASI